MVDNTPRKSIPGRNVNLPPVIVERMELLGMLSTLTQLAIGAGLPQTILRDNLMDLTAMLLERAISSFASFDCSLHNLVKDVGLH